MRSYSVVCCLLSVVSLLGCQFRVPQDPAALVQKLPTDPDSLNPLVSNSAYSSAVAGYIFEQLFELDNETLQPKPKLAKRWEISPDHLQYTFYLRDDVKWQDGQPFTADDVVFTYEKIQDPKVDAAPLRNYFRDVLKAEKLGPYAVRFTYRQPYFGALTTLGLMVVIPKHIYGDGQDFNSHPFNRKPIGTGPFRFVEWKTGQRVMLQRFEGYWDKHPKIRSMVFKIIPDELAAFQLFKKGELDLIDLSSLQWARQTESKKFLDHFKKHKFFTPFGVYNYIGWNEAKPFFKDKRVRLALAHLMDREAINQKLLFGLDYLITGPYYPLGKNYDKSLKPIGYDFQEAGRLLDEAGWKINDKTGIREKEGVPFHFTMLFSPGSQFAEQLTPILSSNFLQAGIEIELRRLEFVALTKLMQEHDFDAIMGGWGRGAGDEDLYQIFHSSQIKGGSNFIGYANPEVDRLLEEGRLEFDAAKRAKMDQQIHQILHDDQPYLFMFARPDLVARDLRFKNVKEYPIGLDVREWLLEE